MPWENHNLKRHKHPSVHCSTMYNNQDMEATARKRLSLWLLKDVIMVKVCDFMRSRALALDPSTHNYLSLFSLLSTIVYISISQSNSRLCFVKKTFCAKWVWKTLFFFECVCVCVCVAVKLACWHWYLNFIVFSCSHEIPDIWIHWYLNFIVISCSHEIEGWGPSPTPQLNTVKTIWRDEYRPLGVIFQPQV